MSIVYIETKTLPPTVLSALTDVGFNRPTIGVYVRETGSVHAQSGDGMRGFTVLLDLDTGERDVHYGSWGGGNPFEARPVDADTRSRPLPPNGCIISGHEGGGRPVYATITIHPSRAAKLLPAAPSDDMSDRLKALAAVYARYNSRGRAERFGDIGAPTEAEHTELERLGIIKRNKAGAVTVTAHGRNVAPSDSWLYRYQDRLRDVG